MAAEASRFIEANRAKPFFIYYALNSPHYPYQGDAKWLEHFKALPYPRNLYAAFVAAQDERLGVLFAKLDELGSRQWPCNDKAPTGTPVMHSAGFVRGKGPLCQS